MKSVFFLSVAFSCFYLLTVFHNHVKTILFCFECIHVYHWLGWLVGALLKLDT